jgi:single-stranded-DNA-specific exonuclease
LIAYGGHAAAAGLKLTAEHFPTFASRFEERCRTSLSPEQLERVLTIDAEIPLAVLTRPVVEEIEKMEPHGISNPRPLLLANGVEIAGEPRAVGGKKNHLQLRLRQGEFTLKAIAWNLAEKGQCLTPGARCSVVFSPSINEWNNRREVQIEIKDFVVENSGTYADS